MTRQHFALIAGVVAELRYSQDEMRARELIANRFASALSSTAPNFNRARFLRACGVE